MPISCERMPDTCDGCCRSATRQAVPPTYPHHWIVRGAHTVALYRCDVCGQEWHCFYDTAVIESEELWG
jgi:hypothetical protein